MSEWWTYRVHDFLMFSPRTYARMFELYNEAIWPINALAAILAFALLFIAVRQRFSPASTPASFSRAPASAPWWQRALFVAVFVYFAVSHAWIALVFMREHYAPIFWAAEYFAYAFLLQAMLFAVAAALALRAADVFCSARSTLVAIVGVSVVSLALLAHPTMRLATVGQWQMLEGVGVAPDPTAMAALGFLLLIRPVKAETVRGQIAKYVVIALTAIAALWCVVSTLTLAAMGSNLAILPAAALIAAIISTLAKRAKM